MALLAGLLLAPLAAAYAHATSTGGMPLSPDGRTAVSASTRTDGAEQVSKCPTKVKARRTCPATFNVHNHSDVGPDASTCPSAFNASGIVPECVYDVCHFQLGPGEGAQQCGAGCCGNDNCSFFVVTPFIKYTSPVCPGKVTCKDPNGLCCWLKGGASAFISGGYTSGSVYTEEQPPPPCPPGQISLSGPKFIGDSGVPCRFVHHNNYRQSSNNQIAERDRCCTHHSAFLKHAENRGGWCHQLHGCTVKRAVKNCTRVTQVGDSHHVLDRPTTSS
eukprot:COSAG02_NODE_19324_length_888_cov_0.657795_1_plen_274_part_01